MHSRLTDHVRSQSITVRNIINMLQTSTGVVVCVSENSRSRFYRLVLFDSFCAIRYTYSVKVSERTKKNMPARNTQAKIIALYTDPESHNQQHYSRTDGRTDDMMMPIACHTV